MDLYSISSTGSDTGCHTLTQAAVMYFAQLVDLALHFVVSCILYDSSIVFICVHHGCRRNETELALIGSR